MTEIINQIAILKKECLNTFPKTSPPKVSQIVESEGFQAPSLRIDFADKEWWTISKDIIDSNFDKMSLFSASTHHYYFPAYLLVALDNFTWKNDVLEFLIYDVSPYGDIDIMEYFEERKSYFSQKEKEIVISFLKLVLKEKDLDIFHDEAKHGINLWEVTEYNSMLN